MSGYSHADRILARWADPHHWDGSQAMSPELRRQYLATDPVSGRPGWRRDAAGREFYSTAWLGQKVPA